MMSKIFKRVLEVLIILVLGISLAACKKNEETKTEEKVDEYGYISVFEELKVKKSDDGYMIGTSIKGDILHYLFCNYKEVRNGNDIKYLSEYEYHKYNITNGNDTYTEFAKEILGDEEYIYEFSVNDDGTLNLGITAYDDEYNSRQFLRRVDAEGKLISTISLADILSADDMYVMSTTFGGDGTIYLITDARFIVLNSEGKVLYSENISGYIQHIVAGSNGKAYFESMNYETWNREIKEFDVNSKKTRVLGADFGDNINSISAGLNNTLLISGDTFVKCYNPETNELKNLWNWYEVDGADAVYGNIIQTGEDKYIVAFQDYSEDETKEYIINIRKELLTEKNRRTNLSYGCIYIDSNVKRDIIAFNRSNEKFRVIPMVYQDLYSDYEEMYAKFEQDASTGKFDIIDGSNLDIDSLARAGALADLSDYYKKDIDTSKYYEQFINAFDINGKKYYVVPSIGVEALVAPASVVGNRTSLTLNDIIEIRKQNPTAAFMEYGTKTNVFYTFFFANVDSYIDYEKATCSFTDDAFLMLLEFANTFPEDIDYENYDSWELLKKGEILFANAMLDEISDFQIKKKMFGDNVVIIGFPSQNGSETVIYGSDKVAISSKSKYQDESWTFLKSLLEEDAQNRVYNVPVLKSAVEAMFEEAGTPETYTDEDGVVHEYPKTTYGFSNGDEIEIYAATKDEIGQVRKAFENVKKVPYVDDKIYEIMSEELDSFFKGAKTSKEVANIIQSRVKIYLAEKN